MEEVTSKPDFGGSGHSLGRHRGCERCRENKGKETENMGHVWGMLYCLVQEAYRLNIVLFIPGFCFVLPMKSRIKVGNPMKWFTAVV